MTQLDEAHELLRAALEIFRDASRGPYVKSLGACKTRANGGGDGACVREEIAEYFDRYGVTVEPQMPELND